MRVATGVDIIDLTIVAATLNDPVQLQRMLHPGDIAKSSPEHIAGRIALKEAAIKALGLGAGDWLKLHIQTAQTGKPVITVRDTPHLPLSLDGSISHHGTMVIGFVVALFDDKDS